MASGNDLERLIGQGDEYELRGDALRLYDAANDAPIIEWRQKCFVELGYTIFEAEKLAVRRDIDRVVVETAIKAGNDRLHVMEALL
jgi:hypothetical protein